MNTDGLAALGSVTIQVEGAPYEAIVDKEGLKVSFYSRRIVQTGDVIVTRDRERYRIVEARQRNNGLVEAMVELLPA